MKHTPGPWESERLRADDARSEIVIYATDQASVARVIWWGSSSEQEVNARLIAAAPDLLAALKECTEAMERHGYVPPCLTRGQRAIAKAEGRQ